MARAWLTATCCGAVNADLDGSIRLLDAGIGLIDGALRDADILLGFGDRCPPCVYGRVRGVGDVNGRIVICCEISSLSTSILYRATSSAIFL